MDDFSPVRSLTINTDGTLEEVSLAYCPTLKSLDLQDNPFFCELHSLPDNHSREFLPGEDVLAECRSLEHGFQSTQPLLLLTKYKLDGLAVTGMSLPFQQAAFKAMARKVTDLMPRLDGLLPSEKTAGAWGSLVTKEDIQHTQIAFLDMQGAEEIGTLIFCRNYSAGMTLVSALRAMTFGEVFDADEHLKEMVRESKVHQLVIRASKTLRGESWQGGVDCLCENHVFRWTHSSLAVSPTGFFEPGRTNCRGYVEAISEFHVAPGHTDAVEDDKRSATAPNDASGVDIHDNDYYRYQIGIGDLVFPYSSAPGGDRFPLVRVTSFLSLICQNCKVFGRPEHTWEHGKDVVDITTTVTIPVPRFDSDDYMHRLIHGCIGDNHYPPLRTVLEEVRRKHFRFQEHSELAPGESGATEEVLKHLSTAGLAKLLPTPLRQTLQYLYQNYSILLGDPYSFDVALDLYDTYATLYAVLTRFLPKRLPQRLSTGYSEMLGSDSAEQVALLVEAVQSALVHRVRHMPKAYPESQMSEMAIDFRGGLNQVLYAADATVRCSLGLLRKYALAKGKADQRDRAGGLIRICLTPGVRCCSLNLGIEDEAVLAYFEVDVAHMLHVSSYTDYLHEAAHLMFEVLRRDERSRMHEIVPPAGVSEEQIGEIFANLMSLVFLFNCDTYRFLHYHLCTYSRSIESNGITDCDTLFRFTELLILLFFAVDAALEGTANSSSLPKTWPHRDGSVDDALRRFERMVDKYGRLFVDYERMWSGTCQKEVRRYCRKQFRIMYKQAFRFMPHVYSGVMDIFGRYWKESLSVETEAGTHMLLKYDHLCVDRKIKDAMRDGMPIIGSLHLNLCDDPDYCGKRKYVAIDNLMLVCGLLRNYVPDPFDLSSVAWHLYRSPDTGKVQFLSDVPSLKREDQKWHDFLADRGATSMFCANPLKREERLKKQIVIFKTLWDVSSRLRARRLIEIINNTMGQVLENSGGTASTP